MNQRIEDLLPYYALGALSDEERAEVDAYVATDAEAKAQLDEMIQTASALPYAVTPVQPPPHLKQALMQRINADVRPRPAAAPRPAPAPAPRRPAFSLARLLDAFRPRLGLALAGLSLVVALGAGAWAVSLNNEVTRLRTALFQLATSNNVQAMVIPGTDHQPNAHGRLVADPSGGSGVLLVAGLSALERDRVYQLWLIRDNVPVSAGLFNVDEDGRAIVFVQSAEAVGSFEAMGVSIEPSGGSEQPTGDIVLLGTLS